MVKSKIEWLQSNDGTSGSTWNPVTGCLRGCEYCYARRIAERFAGGGYGKMYDMFFAKYRDGSFKPPYVLDAPQYATTKDKWYRQAAYPFGFEPTYHRYRLNEPKLWKKPRNIFVCSMADLFGDWVPDEWIREVFKACEAAPQHRYLFLSKNPYRYAQLLIRGRLISGSNVWFGTTLTGKGKMPFNSMDSKQNFISLEPIQEPVSENFPFTNIQWVILGAETGNRKNKVIPKREWINNIVAACRKEGSAVFMKDSLIPIVGEENMIREFPWKETP